MYFKQIEEKGRIVNAKYYHQEAGHSAFTLDANVSGTLSISDKGHVQIADGDEEITFSIQHIDNIDYTESSAQSLTLMLEPNVQVSLDFM